MTYDLKKKKKMDQSTHGMNNLLGGTLNAHLRLSMTVKKQLPEQLLVVLYYFNITITLRFSLSFDNQIEL